MQTNQTTNKPINQQTNNTNNLILYHANLCLFYLQSTCDLEHCDKVLQKVKYNSSNHVTLNNKTNKSNGVQTFGKLLLV